MYKVLNKIVLGKQNVECGRVSMEYISDLINPAG
jgi:hypothetical protein